MGQASLPHTFRPRRSPWPRRPPENREHEAARDTRTRRLPAPLLRQRPLLLRVHGARPIDTDVAVIAESIGQLGETVLEMTQVDHLMFEL